MSGSSLSRRGLLRWVSAAAVASALPAAAFAQAGKKRPNILLIMADDLGWSDIGCYGSEISTPNLDALAKNGMRFTQFYNTARCCPTRAALLTGLYPHQAGVGHMIGDRGLPPYQGYLNDSCVTIAEAIAPAGYHPLLAGKWHVGEKPGRWPLDRGFERYYGLISGACSYFSIDKGRTFVDQDQVIDPAASGGFYMTDAISDRAVKYIEEYAKKPEPFFIYTAYTSPHWPLHAKEEDISKYRGRHLMGWDKLREQRLARMIELGILPKGTTLSERDPQAKAWEDLPEAKKREMDERMAVYCAQVEAMDRGIGRIIGKLKETGQFENTLILFLADNGGCAEAVDRGEAGAKIGSKESFASYGLPWANASNTPLRMYKQRVHEGGISSPLIAHWPGHVAPGSLSHEVGHVIDLLPTCLDAAGAAYPKTFKGKPITPAEGRSLVPTLEGKQRQSHEAIYWEHQGNRAVRKGDWKIVSLGAKDWELYDLSRDRIESNNLAEKHPEKLKELAAMYDAWAKRCGVVPFAKLPK